MTQKRIREENLRPASRKRPSSISKATRARTKATRARTKAPSTAFASKVDQYPNNKQIKIDSKLVQIKKTAKKPTHPKKTAQTKQNNEAQTKRHPKQKIPPLMCSAPKARCKCKERQSNTSPARRLQGKHPKKSNEVIREISRGYSCDLLLLASRLLSDGYSTQRYNRKIAKGWTAGKTAN